ncbi:hypothetical protein UCRPC4_g01161 [Phaeomoniella chlamydospora]|uniref:Uncharacterized protein n=1 Tax=Phaeomoniella chlamydospora TaxID=158046 RepID=A0A0G2HFL3_PHACM|nr:hypothetical protein UCRPC4_g01161 [Phaeomoniella chlamydospora]
MANFRLKAAIPNLLYMNPAKAFPVSGHQWKALAKNATPNLPQNITDYQSGSSFRLEHILALRILWADPAGTKTTRSSKVFQPTAEELEYIEKAKRILCKECVFWTSYLQILEDLQGDRSLYGPEAQKKFGVFALVVALQRACQHIKRSDTKDTRILGTPRKTRVVACPPIQGVPYSGFRKDPRHQAQDSDSEDGADSDHELNDETYTQPVPLKARYKAEDEQIVNTALVTLLQAVTMQAADLEDSEWTMKRMSFSYTCNNKALPDGKKINYLFRSMTDGALRIGRDKEKARIILEVKARSRAGLREDNTIRYQEASELFAWIFESYKSRRIRSGQKHRRFLFAQDHQDIYIIVASFSDTYIKFVLGLDQSPTEYMEVQEYGPYRITTQGDMECLGPIVLGLTKYYLDMDDDDFHKSLPNGGSDDSSDDESESSDDVDALSRGVEGTHLDAGPKTPNPSARATRGSSPTRQPRPGRVARQSKTSQAPERKAAIANTNKANIKGNKPKRTIETRSQAPRTEASSFKDPKGMQSQTKEDSTSRTGANSAKKETAKSNPKPKTKKPEAKTSKPSKGRDNNSEDSDD